MQCLTANLEIRNIFTFFARRCYLYIFHYCFVKQRNQANQVNRTSVTSRVTSVVVNWKAPDSDGGSPITNYIVEYRTEGKTRWVKASEGKTVPDTTFKVRI